MSRAGALRRGLAIALLPLSIAPVFALGPGIAHAPELALHRTLALIARLERGDART